MDAGYILPGGHSLVADFPSLNMEHPDVGEAQVIEHWADQRELEALAGVEVCEEDRDDGGDVPSSKYSLQ